MSKKSAHTIHIVGAGKVDIIGDKAAVDYIVKQYTQLEKYLEARIAELKGE